jgi:hypothetical protein
LFSFIYDIGILGKNYSLHTKFHKEQDPEPDDLCTVHGSYFHSLNLLKCVQLPHIDDSVADQGCFIPDPRFFSSRISDPTSYVKRGVKPFSSMNRWQRRKKDHKANFRCPYNSLHNNSLQHNSLQHNSLHHY